MKRVTPRNGVTQSTQINHKMIHPPPVSLAGWSGLSLSLRSRDNLSQSSVLWQVFLSEELDEITNVLPSVIWSLKMKNYKEVLHLMKLHISDLTFVSNNVLGKDLAQQMFFFTDSFWWEVQKYMPSVNSVSAHCFWNGKRLLKYRKEIEKQQESNWLYKQTVSVK